ncbi:pyridine nucleotide-disulfide oxidoreductase [Paenibacillus sp. CCS19]|uniref:NAD(P)/FAD-dependent oxidoreductase n=1 Tax=Paenibacillus sp. CCS19 TaxID=3158387 RepID=UPI00256A6187|nr:NAD(P)/FAD-dependent oxidoreductase [Paenibacillus cellulosilyticus]GMK40332.1 pyridine nucleotide-disulfide oxidoreductase [Paenibacillus cellulosilyticus]
MSKQILILGGGYGGVLAALSARKELSAAEATITLVNRFSTHQIITELHRLAGGTIKEGAVALPLNKLLGSKGINVLVDSVKNINPNENQVVLDGGSTLKYDYLVVALGSETNYFGIPGLEENSLVLKSAADANKIRAHVEARLDAYKKSGDKKDATIVVGGGGLTGVELVGEFADKLPEICRSKGINFSDISIYCVEAGPSILPMLPKPLIERSVESLTKRGIKFLTGVAITEASKDTVSLKDGSKIESNTIIWTGGVKGNPIVGSCGLAEDRGRSTVTPTLQSTSHANVFLAGDCAVVFPEGSERPYPPTAQLAWQMGELVGLNLAAAIRGGAMEKFNPVFSGTLASLGRKDGVGSIGGNNTQLKGLPASLMKEASNIRYLSHINGLFALAH